MPTTAVANRQLLTPPGGGAWTTIDKTADETKTANTTLANDSTLLFSMTGNAKYAVRGKIFFVTTANADFKYSFAYVTAPASVFRVTRKHIVPGTTTLVVAVMQAADNGVAVTAVGTGTDGGYIEFDAVVNASSSGGTFSFQWAQNTSDAGNTIVRAGSYLEWQLI